LAAEFGVSPNSSFLLPWRGVQLNPTRTGGKCMAISMDRPTTSAVEQGVSKANRLHHAAWVTRDQEATRHFYEDILGVPLVATWCERGMRDPQTGKEREYCHTFFAFNDGGALAFFQYADQDERPVE